jgi:hypothetical protein
MVQGKSRVDVQAPAWNSLAPDGVNGLVQRARS